ncbi:hypothetical protein MPR_2112 [Myroides profundi]|nr:hypothetical protein MPR_2112 [Myroides profundi]
MSFEVFFIEKKLKIDRDFGCTIIHDFPPPSDKLRQLQ